MDNINEEFIKSSKLVTEMNIPNEYIANMAKIGQEYASSIQTTAELTLDYIEVAREVAQNVLKQFPMDSIIKVQETVEANVKPLLESIGKLAESIPFEQILEIVDILEEIHLEGKLDEDAVLTDDMLEELLMEVKIKMEENLQSTDLNVGRWRACILSLSKKYSVAIIWFVMGVILSPYIETTETYIREKTEDSTGIDMTGEVALMIREEVYLRTESSEHAPVVLETTLKEAQSVLRLERDGDWIRISVLIDGETHTGWVEKSKLTK